MIVIAVVWLASGVISIPPLFGWNNNSVNTTSLYNSVDMTCKLTDEPSFVLYSASGSFYIPLVVMAFVYVNIYVATKERLRRRAASSLLAKLPGGPGHSLIGGKRCIVPPQIDTPGMAMVVVSNMGNNQNDVTDQPDVDIISRNGSTESTPKKLRRPRLVESFLRHASSDRNGSYKSETETRVAGKRARKKRKLNSHPQPHGSPDSGTATNRLPIESNLSIS